MTSQVARGCGSEQPAVSVLGCSGTIQLLGQHAEGGHFNRRSPERWESTCILSCLHSRWFWYYWREAKLLMLTNWLSLFMWLTWLNPKTHKSRHLLVMFNVHTSMLSTYLKPKEKLFCSYTCTRYILPL